MVSVNGEPATRRTQFVLQQAKPGSELAVVVRREGQEVPLKLAVGSKQVKRLHVEEEHDASPEQVALRKGWLTQEDAR